MEEKKVKAVPEAPEEKNTAEYYQLNTSAVDALVNASDPSAPPVPEEELRKFRRGFLYKIPMWMKIFFGKWWFAGVGCYFILWGLGAVIPDMPDMLFVLAFGLGLLTDLLLENIIRFFSDGPAAYEKWLMFPKKGWWTLFCNIPYAFLLTGCVVWFYELLNLIILSVSGGTDTVPLGVEPILFGLFYLGFDLLFVSMRNLFKKIIADAKAKTEARP